MRQFSPLARAALATASVAALAIASAIGASAGPSKGPRIEAPPAPFVVAAPPYFPAEFEAAERAAPVAAPLDTF